MRDLHLLSKRSLAIVQPEKIENEQKLVYKNEDGLLIREETQKKTSYFMDTPQTRE